MNRRSFIAALIAGAVIRAAALPLHGTHDVDIWKNWSYNAATHGVTQMYGVGGSPPERRLLDFHGDKITVDYPPVALFELGVVGRVYRAMYGPEYPDTVALTVVIKIAIVLSEVGLIALIFFAARRAADESTARWAVAAYWLNPAAILTAAALGYVDSFFILPAVGGLVAATFGWPVLAGALASAAILTKPQALMIAPATAVAIWNSGSRATLLRRASAATAGGVLAAAAAVVPIIAAGALPNMRQALGRLATHDMLSANACNVWWILGYVVRAANGVHDLGAWAAFTEPTKILGILRTMELGYPNPRVIGTLLTVAAMGWALWTARRVRELWLIAALGAFLVHAYFTLSVQVHENHLFSAIPLLAIAAAGRPDFRRIFVAVSAIFALNLNVFYGISEGAGYAIPRGLTIIDLTVVLAAANCAALWWHATILRRECSTARCVDRRATESGRCTRRAALRGRTP